jgi:hypothetical protein
MQTAQFHGSVKWFKSYQYLKNSRWLPSCSHLGFKKMNSVGNIPCGSEVGHQISKGSIERFKSYRDLKISKMAEGLRPPSWTPSWILVNLNILGNSYCGSEVGHQISKGSIERFKRYRALKNSKMAAGLRPP